MADSWVIQQDPQILQLSTLTIPELCRVYNPRHRITVLAEDSPFAPKRSFECMHYVYRNVAHYTPKISPSIAEKSTHKCHNFSISVVPLEIQTFLQVSNYFAKFQGQLTPSNIKNNSWTKVPPIRFHEYAFRILRPTNLIPPQIEGQEYKMFTILVKSSATCNCINRKLEIGQIRFRRLTLPIGT